MLFTNNNNLNKKKKIAALLLAIVGISFAFLYLYNKKQGALAQGAGMVCLLEEEAPIGQLMHQMELTSQSLINNLKLVSYYSRQAIAAAKTIYDLSASPIPFNASDPNRCGPGNCTPSCSPTVSPSPTPPNPTTSCTADPIYTCGTWQGSFFLGNALPSSVKKCDDLNNSFNPVANSFYAKFTYSYTIPETPYNPHSCSCRSPGCSCSSLPGGLAYHYPQTGGLMIGNQGYSRTDCLTGQNHTCIQSCIDHPTDMCGGKNCQEWENTWFDAYTDADGAWCVHEWSCTCWDTSGGSTGDGVCYEPWPCATICTPGQCGRPTTDYSGQSDTNTYACPFAKIDAAANKLKVARNRIVDAVGPRTTPPFDSIEGIFTCKITSLPPILGNTCKVAVFKNDPRYKTCPATPIIFPQGCSSSTGERIINDFTNPVPAQRTSSIIFDLLKYTRTNLDKCHLVPGEIFQPGKNIKYLIQCPEAASLEPMLKKCYPYNQECCMD